MLTKTAEDPQTCQNDTLNNVEGGGDENSNLNMSCKLWNGGTHCDYSLRCHDEVLDDGLQFEGGISFFGSCYVVS